MQLVLSLAPGGTERLVVEIVRRVRAGAIESLVCCLEAPGAWAAEVEQLGVPVVSVGRRAGFNPSLGRTIARLISGHAIDVVHCHHYSPFVYGQIAALLSRRAGVVFTEHGRLSDAPPSRKRRLVNPLLCQLPSAIFAVSEDLRRHMVAEGFAERSVQVVHNGIEVGPPVTAAARQRARKTLGISGDALVIGTVARLDPVKELGTLVEAFARVRQQCAQARLVIVGDGPEGRALREQIARLDLSATVALPGHRQDVRELLPALDLFANSSVHEGVSLTILEAMAASIPVVATNVGGTAEVVVDGTTGILVASRRPDALAAALLELGRNPARRSTLGLAARRRVETSFSVERMVETYLESYRRCATTPSGRALRLATKVAGNRDF